MPVTIALPTVLMAELTGGLTGALAGGLTGRSTAAPAKAGAVEVHDFPSGGGETAMLVRTMDWSATGLGPIETWPQSLRTTVSLCLASNFPINIVWGPAHVQIYNDGYRSIIGNKHPDSMGQDFSVCWAPAWPAIGEAFDRGWAGEASYIENERMFLYRNGFLEETFFTFSFSPIRDERGAIGGLFHPVTEQTGRILSERRLQMLRDLATHAGSARTRREVYARAVEVFAEHRNDLPFVLLYELTEQASRAERVAQAGLPGTAASSEHFDLTADAVGWPFADALAAKTGVLTAADRWLDGHACGPYEEVPKTAFVLPIFSPGSETAAAVLVAGVSARLPLNAAYQHFYGSLAAGLAACLDNADNYEAERERAEAAAELDRAKTIFFSNISHEFRTPLSLILGSLDEVMNSSTDLLAPFQSQCLEAVRRNAQRVLKLVNTILDFSRLDTGQTRAQPQATNLAMATAEHASSFRSLCERAGLRLTVDCDAALDAVYIDRDMWEKIILNLFSNAFKFTFTGEIQVGLQSLDGEWIELIVRDTGIGIPPETLPYVFERFTRAENGGGRAHEGSGIGLALVQELVKLLGGSVAVESSLGAGSTFRVLVPWRRAATADTAAAGAAGGLPITARSRSFVEDASLWLPEMADSGAEFSTDAAALSGAAETAPIIVLADDNADMRGFVSRILSRGGFKVIAAADGEAALAAIRDGPMPDLVITDVMMPKLDGFGLLKYAATANCGICRFSCSRRAPERRPRWRGCAPAPMITWSSHSARANWWRASTAISIWRACANAWRCRIASL
jgi:signal transduction histidine kinase